MQLPVHDLAVYAKSSFIISLFNITKAAPQGSTELSSQHNFHYYYYYCYGMNSSKHQGTSHESLPPLQECDVGELHTRGQGRVRLRRPQRKGELHTEGLFVSPVHPDSYMVVL